MGLHNKLLVIYPELTEFDFVADQKSSDPKIVLQNDGNGDYIAKWEHPTLARPTDEQLEAAGQ